MTAVDVVEDLKGAALPRNLQRFLEELEAGRAELTAEELAVYTEIRQACAGHPGAQRELAATVAGFVGQRAEEEEARAQQALEIARAIIDPPLVFQPERFPTPAEIKDSAAEIMGAPPAQQMNFPFYSPTPTVLCRVSPFYPLSAKDKAVGKRVYLEQTPLVVDNAWGRIVYTGPQLSITEEDVLVALLALIEEGARTTHQVEAVVAKGGDRIRRSAYSYVGSRSKLAQVAFGVKQPNKDEYARLDRALRLLTSAVFEMQIKGKTARGRVKFDPFFLSNVVMAVSYPAPRKIAVQLNPFFHEMFASNRVTLLDAAERGKLKHDTAKALYRFILSHNEPHWVGKIETLARSINIKEDQTLAKKTQTLRGALAELKKAEILLSTSRIKGDQIFLYRNAAKEPAKLRKQAAIEGVERFKRAAVAEAKKRRDQ